MIPIQTTSQVLNRKSLQVTVVKPKYKCPQCGEAFTRRWNMRAHCRNTHKYDPLPNQVRKEYGFSNYPASGEAKDAINPNSLAIQTAIKRIVDMMNDLSKFMILGWGPQQELGAKDLRGPEYFLNNLVDDYVIVRKKDISGISGYLCKRCWSFEFRYIKDIGYDLTASEAHRCSRTMINAANLENRIQLQNELIKQKDDCLVNLTNSLFSENKVLMVNSDSDRVKEISVHAPTIKLDQIVPEHWACKPLLEKEMELSDYYLRRVIADMDGTFAQILIENGDFAGSYLMYIRSY